jgi:hypothetical protein
MFDLKNFETSMPYRFDKPEDLLNKVLYIETSRGCPYKCEFCLASLDNKVRYLPNASTKATLLHMMEHGKVIKYLDRTFNIKISYAKAILNYFLAKEEEYFLHFEVIPDNFPEELRDLIKQFKNKDHPIRDRLISSLGTACTENQRQQFSIYLSEFAKRRNLAIDIFPESMLKWLKLQ